MLSTQRDPTAAAQDRTESLWLHTQLFTALLIPILCVLQAQLWLSLGSGSC